MLVYHRSHSLSIFSTHRHFIFSFLVNSHSHVHSTYVTFCFSTRSIYSSPSLRESLLSQRERGFGGGRVKFGTWRQSSSRAGGGGGAGGCAGAERPPGGRHPSVRERGGARVRQQGLRPGAGRLRGGHLGRQQRWSLRWCSVGRWCGLGLGEGLGQDLL